MTKIAAPQISVVMPVYNAGRYLKPAIESVLSQTEADFEFIIINDGSSDGSLKILQAYAKKDPRIVLISQANQGIVAALNTGVAQARGAYIARMDADDISLPTRFAKQRSLLDSQLEVVVVGCGLTFVDTQDKPVLSSPMLSHDAGLRLELMLRSPFAHGSVMMRASALPQPAYRTKYWPAEDYDLWRRLALVGQLANINKVLFQYRDMETGISGSNTDRQAERTREIQAELWRGIASQGLITRSAEAVDRYEADGKLVAARAVKNYIHVWQQALRHGKLSLWLRMSFGIVNSRLIRRKIKDRLG